MFMRNVIFYKKSKILSFLSIILNFFGFNTFSINDKNKIKNTKVLPLPSSKLSTKFERRANDEIKSYFEKTSNTILDGYIRDYLSKQCSFQSLSFYSMLHSADNLLGKDNYIIFGGGLIKNVYYQNINKKSCIISYIFFGFIYLTLLQIKALSYMLFNRQNLSVQDVSIVRKKAKYDNDFSSNIKKKLNNQNINSSIVLTQFSNEGKKHGFNCIFSYQSSIKRSFENYLFFISELSLYAKCLASISVPYDMLRQTLKDAYLMRFLAKLDSKAYIGILHDKPNHIFLKKYIRDDQYLLTIYEAFLYEPFLNFNFVYADSYYCLNDIDKSSVNEYGGDISNFKEIGFRASEFASKFSRGISNDLSSIIENYRKIVLVTLPTIGQGSFSYYDAEFLHNSIKELVTISNNLNGVLIILKGKKGEMNMIADNIFDDSKNIYPIKSDKPKELEFNQFEDLIKISDLTISMNVGSTTIWQSIFYKVPIISLNEIHPKSFLSSYPQTEVSIENLEKAITYWLFEESKSKISTINQLHSCLNLKKQEALDIVCSDLCKMLN